MREVTFKLKKGTEFPERFAGIEARYMLPETLDEIRGLVDPSVQDVDGVIVAGFNGQGYNLSVQKYIKDFLATDAVKEMSPEEGVAAAVSHATSRKLGAPRVISGTKKERVEKAEARANASVSLALDMYRRLPRGMRKQFREQILEGGILTAAQLDEVDAEQ
jgi:hypothetical protein